MYLGARNKSKAEAAIKELKEETGKEAIFWEIDLSSLAAVRKGAEEFLRYELYIILTFNPKRKTNARALQQREGITHSIPQCVSHLCAIALVLPLSRNSEASCGHRWTSLLLMAMTFNGGQT